MLEPGDPVVDRESDEPDVMRVLRTNVGTADEVEVTELRKSVYELNPDYSHDDTVIETVYETWLDSYVPNWVDWPMDEFRPRLMTYAKRWSVSVKSYYYPRSRLKPINNSKNI